MKDIISHSTSLHAQVVKELISKQNLSREEIDVIGYHGQTMFHQPDKKISIIVGDGQFLADELGIAVINDFRSNDIAHGGQGAPFAPIYHQALGIRDNKIPLAVLNCGGISNITIINSKVVTELIGFDTGPGNGLIDQLVFQRTKGKENMDQDGKYGEKGSVNQIVLDKLFEKSILKNGENYFKALPPKSLDFGDMKLIDELDSLSLEDAARTLEAFTAETIVRSLSLVSGPIPRCWALAGGGWNNPVIKKELKDRLLLAIEDPLQVMTADEIGWNGRALEAQIFSYFAVRSLLNQPLSVPGTTRVSHPISGGKLYLPRTAKTSQKVIQLLEKKS